MEKCKQIIAAFSTDIRIDFGLEKCAVVHTAAGKIIDSPCVTDIPLLSRKDDYKYLGILECDVILHSEVKVAVEKEYFSRV